jgi:hypothetical protein
LSDQAAQPPGAPDRRIDITIARISDEWEAMPIGEREILAAKPWFNTLLTATRLRAMEREEEEAFGRDGLGLADAYDRLVQPGELAIPAVLRAFSDVYGRKDRTQ